ncbi:MAG: hypothetical protein WAT81_01925 [Candidatus Moraniibacteriota bacterium]
MLVSESGTGDVMLPEIAESLWEKLRTLPAEKHNIIVSTELPQRLVTLKEKLQLEDKAIGCISLVVRKIFFGELDFPGAEAKIGSMFAAGGFGDPNQAKAIVEFIQKEILTIKPVQEVVPEDGVVSPVSVKTVRLPLLKAMSEYRHLSEQLLTGEKIKVKGSMESVRPSLGNWLKSYREELGIGFHETVLRGNFLFQSQNCKRLTNEERARLNLVLKSIEEEFPLEIDTTREVIVFPAGSDASMELTQVKSRPLGHIIRPRGLQTSPATPSGTVPVAPSTTPVKTTPFQAFKPLFAKSAAPEKNVSGETLHFSTGHVLPAEREVNAPPASPDGNEALRQMQHPIQAIKRELKAPLSKSPYSIRPLRSRNSNTGSA